MFGDVSGVRDSSVGSTLDMILIAAPLKMCRKFKSSSWVEDDQEIIRTRTVVMYRRARHQSLDEGTA